MAVKYIPAACYSGTVPQKHYQYTVIDKVSRERFIYPYMEQFSYSTCDFLEHAITYFIYKPKQLQTDNGAKFTHLKKTDRTHPFWMFYAMSLESNTNGFVLEPLNIMAR